MKDKKQWVQIEIRKIPFKQKERNIVRVGEQHSILTSGGVELDGYVYPPKEFKYSETDHMLWVFFRWLPWFKTRQNISKHTPPIYVKQTPDTETSCSIFKDCPEQVISCFAFSWNLTYESLLCLFLI